MDIILEIPLLAQAAITWTPVTFYVAAGILQTLVILLAFHLLAADPEHNTFFGALIAAAIANVLAYYLRDAGLFGILTAAVVYLGLLVAISSGEIIKSLVVFVVCLASYGLMGTFLLPRTPLHIDELAGLPRVMMTGGLEAEPITEDDADRLAAPSGD